MKTDWLISRYQISQYNGFSQFQNTAVTNNLKQNSLLECKWEKNPYYWFICLYEISIYIFPSGRKFVMYYSERAVKMSTHYMWTWRAFLIIFYMIRGVWYAAACSSSWLVITFLLLKQAERQALSLTLSWFCFSVRLKPIKSFLWITYLCLRMI